MAKYDKVLVTVFWDMHNVLLVDFAEYRTTLNAVAYIKTLVKLRHAIHGKCHNINVISVKILHKNAHAHITIAVQEKITKMGAPKSTIQFRLCSIRHSSVWFHDKIPGHQTICESRGREISR